MELKFTYAAMRFDARGDVRKICSGYDTEKAAAEAALLLGYDSVFVVPEAQQILER